MPRQTSLYLIVIGAFMLFISGNFLSEGLSRVGMDNAVVSQRMAEGFEDFWLPSMNNESSPDRLNYLPLGYWLEGVWYRMFGDNSFMAEKVYSVLTYIILAFLVICIWRMAGQSEKTGWLPLLCWISIPLVSWSATNNLLESTMTIFVLLSVLFLLKAYRAAFIVKSRHAAGKQGGAFRWERTLWIVLSACMMELAFMVKGVMGLFPVFFPFLYWLMVRRERVVVPIVNTLIIVVVWIVTVFAVIVFSVDIYGHLYNYLHRQLIGGLLHVQTVASHFFIVYALLRQAVIPLIIIVVLALIRIKQRPVYIYLLHRRNRKRLTADQRYRARMGWFYFTLACSGVLPIMFGLKQQEFYLVPILPFFAIAMACLLYELVEDWISRIGKTAQHVLAGLAIVVFVSGLILNISSIHKINSNYELLSDMKIILPCLGEGECVGASSEIIENPEVTDYFYRYKNITFDTSVGHRHILTMYGKITDTGYTCMELPTVRYHLYEAR